MVNDKKKDVENEMDLFETTEKFNCLFEGGKVWKFPFLVRQYATKVHNRQLISLFISFLVLL